MFSALKSRGRIRGGGGLCLLMILPLTSAYAKTTDFAKVKKSLHWQETPANTVLISFFLSSRCPCTGRILSVIKEVERKYGGSANWKISYVDENGPQGTSPLEKALKKTTLRDSDHALADEVGATVTPEVWVWRSRGELLYHGAVDTEQPAKGQTAPLLAALGEIEKNKSPAKPFPEPFGCAIHDSFVDSP